MVALDNTKGRTMNTKVKKLLTTALAAVALATASLGATGEAFAHGRGGGYFHGYRSGFYFSSPAYSSCWGWYGGRRTWVCY
jgi:hypothetical protein